MPRSAKRKLHDVERNLSSSKTFVGTFSYLDRFVIKAKKFSFFLICKLNIVCFYVTRKTFEIFDPNGFLDTMKHLKEKVLCKLASFAQNKEVYCNAKKKNVCSFIFASFIKLRDSGLSFFRTIKKLL